MIATTKTEPNLEKLRNHSKIFRKHEKLQFKWCHGGFSKKSKAFDKTPTTYNPNGAPAGGQNKISQWKKACLSTAGHLADPRLRRARTGPVRAREARGRPVEATGGQGRARGRPWKATGGRGRPQEAKGGQEGPQEARGGQASTREGPGRPGRPGEARGGRGRPGERRVCFKITY